VIRKRTLILLTLGAWLIACALYGYHYVVTVLAVPEPYDLPVLALTGFGRPDDIERVRNAGFFSHITKPFDLEKLSATLQTVNGWRRGPS